MLGGNAAARVGVLSISDYVTEQGVDAGALAHTGVSEEEEGSHVVKKKPETADRIGKLI